MYIQWIDVVMYTDHRNLSISMILTQQVNGLYTIYTYSTVLDGVED